MSFTGTAISLYKRSPFYPKWSGTFAKMLATVKRISGVPLIQKKNVPCGIALNIDREQWIDTKVLHGRFEPDTIGLLERVVKPGWKCCDVGANIGVLSLIMAKQVGPEGRVFAFEPSQWTFERLQANIQINPYPWVEPHRAAVGTESKTSIELRVPSGYRLDGKDTSSVQEMPLVALDDFFANESRLDFLKIDTDGYEPQVLAGSWQTIKRLHPLILFELGPDHLARAGSSAKELIESLVSNGYSFEDERGNKIDAIAEASKIYSNGSVNVLAKSS